MPQPPAKKQKMDLEEVGEDDYCCDELTGVQAKLTEADKTHAEKLATVKKELATVKKKLAKVKKSHAETLTEADKTHAEKLDNVKKLHAETLTEADKTHAEKLATVKETAQTIKYASDRPHYKKKTIDLLYRHLHTLLRLGFSDDVSGFKSVPQDFSKQFEALIQKYKNNDTWDTDWVKTYSIVESKIMDADTLRVESKINEESRSAPAEARMPGMDPIAVLLEKPYELSLATGIPIEDIVFEHKKRGKLNFKDYIKKRMAERQYKAKAIALSLSYPKSSDTKQPTAFFNATPIPEINVNTALENLKFETIQVAVTDGGMAVETGADSGGVDAAANQQGRQDSRSLKSLGRNIQKIRAKGTEYVTYEDTTPLKHRNPTDGDYSHNRKEREQEARNMIRVQKYNHHRPHHDDDDAATASIAGGGDGSDNGHPVGVPSKQTAPSLSADSDNSIKPMLDGGDGIFGLGGGGGDEIFGLGGGRTRTIRNYRKKRVKTKRKKHKKKTYKKGKGKKKIKTIRSQQRR